MAKLKREKKKVRPQAYGSHLILDGYGADSKKLADVGLRYDTLNSLPKKIGMHKIGFPHIIQFTKVPITGISGFIFILESHISIHTYSAQRFISVDVYSCRRFNPEIVIRFLEKIYRIKKMETNLVKRGTYFNLK